MTTRLADVIEPALWARYLLQLTTQMSRLIQSGIAAVDSSLQSQISVGGMTYNLPFWNDLSDTEANISSDNPASSATPEKIGTGQDVAVKHARNQAFSAADLVQTVIGEDPMGVMANRAAEYWVRQDQAQLISTLGGIELDNVANDTGDMVHDVANDLASAPLAADLVGPDTVLEAAQTMGDSKGKLVAICMHSRPYTELQRQNAIVYRDETLPGSDQKVRIPTYLGHEVIVDDGCPAVSGVNRITYTSYLFGRGAVAIAEGAARVPVAIEREELQGDGGGVETLVSRRVFAQHVRGVKWTGTAAGVSPTNTEINLAASFDRVYDRKNVRLAILKTNG